MRHGLNVNTFSRFTSSSDVPHPRRTTRGIEDTRLGPIRLRPAGLFELGPFHLGQFDLGQFDFGQFELGQFDLGQQKSL